MKVASGLVLALLGALASAATGGSVVIVRGDGRVSADGEEIGGLCLVRVEPGPNEVILRPAATADHLALSPVEESPEGVFWLPCDSLAGRVTVRGTWFTPDGRRQEASRTVRVRTISLRLRAVVVPEIAPGRRVYAAGSLFALGMRPDGTWQPRSCTMTPLGGGHWYATVGAGPRDRCTVEFTLGGWGTKGRNETGSVVKVTAAVASHTEMAAKVANFGLRSGSPGPIAEHLSLSSPSGDHMVLAFRDGTERRSVAIGPSPTHLSPARAKKDEGGWFVEFATLRPMEERYYALAPQADPRRVQVPREDAISFCVVGDIQSRPSVIKPMMAESPPELVLHVGDLVNAGWDEGEWSRNMAEIQPAASAVPYMVVPGNHEEESPIFREIFHFPHEEYYYAFRYGPARFLMLDSEAPYEPGTPQRAFAESVLAAWSTMPGPVFVGLHAPPFSNGWHGSDLGVRRELCPLFEAMGVSIVFSGHDHGYEATWPLRRGEPQEGGTVYVVSGGGGARLYDSRPGSPIWSRGRHARHHWLTVQATRSSVSVTARTPEGETLDRFEVVPARPG